MSSQKIRYLLEEKGRYYYQRKVPKALLYHVGYSRWHIPVGNTFDGAQTAVAKLREEHDALIAKAKADPNERTRLRREKDMRVSVRETQESLEDDKYRADVVAGVIDDPQELINAEFEETVINAEPIWQRTSDWLKALENERTADIGVSLIARPEDEIYTSEKFEDEIKAVKHMVSEETLEEWRNRYVGKAGIRFSAYASRKMEDDEYHDQLKARYEASFASTADAPKDENERLEWDIIKMKLERLMARYAPPADRLSAVFKSFLTFHDIKTEAKYRRVFNRFVEHTGDIPISQITPRLGDCILDKPTVKAYFNLNKLEVLPMSVLSAPYMHDEAAAFAHVEAILWGDAPVCAHCGVVDKAYPLVGVRTKPSDKNPEGKERHGLWKCRECRKQFTVRKGSIFEESHLPLHLWLQAIHLMVSSKKGISSHQLHRVLGITYKSAWFLTHRIRECMRDGALAGFGGGGGIVEVDETFIGKEPNMTKAKNARGYAHKMKMVTLVDRTTKKAKSIVVDDLKKSMLIPMLQENIAKEAYVMTDEAKQYENRGGRRISDQLLRWINL